MVKNNKDLEKELQRIDGRGYKVYKDITGEYLYHDYVLSVDYVQSDPFAPPSRVRVILSQEKAQFPCNLFDESHKKTAVIDFLTRLFADNIDLYYKKIGGSGKSGLLSIGKYGQEMLERTSIFIDKTRLEARFEVGLPAAGRSVLGKAANKIFSEILPTVVKHTLYYGAIDQKKLRKQVELAVDQQYIREELIKRKLVAFVSNGAILPRESGISDKPLQINSIPFQSPPSLEVEMVLPHKGRIKGMGIPEGITLIVGGGYHGKSTLLKALELGVYNHIADDGREYVITRGNGVKIRAEDGRSIEKTNISSFINNLPNGKNTINFSTENASGSTSQAANIIEAMEIGTDLLLIDEDTSATNFMIRDDRMRQLVHKDKEPITPFIDKIRQLYENRDISTVLVIGGSGDYFQVADHVIMMDAYVPKEVTSEAKKISETIGNTKVPQTSNQFGEISKRVLLQSSFPRSSKEVKIKAKGLHTITYNHLSIDLDYLEQLVDVNQTNSIAFMLRYIMENLVDDRTSLSKTLDILYNIISQEGLEAISPYTGHPGNLVLPRKQEVAAALNRYRYLRVK